MNNKDTVSKATADLIKGLYQNIEEFEISREISAKQIQVLMQENKELRDVVANGFSDTKERQYLIYMDLIDCLVRFNVLDVQEHGGTVHIQIEKPSFLKAD
jgi:hypothetical protein